MFVKYNAVLRGLNSPVHFLKNTMVLLCCLHEHAMAYLGDAKTWEAGNGELSFQTVRDKYVNTYTTTLHAINSSVVKLSKLTYAGACYRGVSGMVLPESFWHANEFGVKGGIERGFMSCTLDGDVAKSYAAGRAGFVFRIQMGMIDRGADFSSISQYPHERGEPLPMINIILTAPCAPDGPWFGL
jgi:hypothetical protein